MACSAELQQEDLPWLEGLSALAFCTVAALFGRILGRSSRNCNPKSQAQPQAQPGVDSTANQGSQMRRLLAVCLLAANAARCLSLAVEVVLQPEVAETGTGEGPLFSESLLRNWSPLQRCWLGDLLALLPAVVFLSAFSTVVLFWAQLHYTTTIVPLPLMDCLFASINVACYLLVTVIAVSTFILRAYSHLWTYMACIIGFLDTALAASLLYYGLMVVLELRETSRKRTPGRWLTERIVVLLVVWPVALLLRGSFFLAWGLSLARRSRLLDLLLCLTSEWLPSVVALAVLRPLQPSRTQTQSQRLVTGDLLNDSTDSEEPLLSEDVAQPPRFFAGAGERGLTWKQLYPQPPGA